MSSFLISTSRRQESRQNIKESPVISEPGVVKDCGNVDHAPVLPIAGWRSVTPRRPLVSHVASVLVSQTDQGSLLLGMPCWYTSHGHTQRKRIAQETHCQSQCMSPESDISRKYLLIQA